MNNTPTPRTDYLLSDYVTVDQLIDHAREIETELTAVTEQRDRLAENLNKMISICSCETEDIDTVNEIRYFVDTITKHSNP